jgi:hypothetical protein
LSHHSPLPGPSQHKRISHVSLSEYEEGQMTIATTESTMTDHEAAQIDRANATKATPVVFVHGLWLLPSS